ncbi:MAG: thrombospondin type 3 repeat-containing protein, partial [Pseudomonadota bacterium]
IDGTAAGSDPRSIGFEVSISDMIPGESLLAAPADGASDVSTAPIFMWDAVPQATGYILQVDDDPAFGSPDFEVTTAATSATLSGSLASTTTYFWRVIAENPCGIGIPTVASSFTTAAEICIEPSLFIDSGAPDGVTSTTALAESGIIDMLDVSLEVTQTWVGDLAFILTHEDTGTSVTLIDRPGVPASEFGCDGDNIDAVMTDSSTTPVETTCLPGIPALGGDLQPQEPLAAFAGEDIGGTWTITASDGFPEDEGTLTRWCLLPTFASGADSDGDGVADAADNCTLIPNADQRDTNGDGFGNACDADLNNDGVVNVVDLGLLRSVFFSADADADLNGDGVVNVVDLGIMRSGFFAPPGPSGVAP